jgi:hypothetical protein
MGRFRYCTEFGANCIKCSFVLISNWQLILGTFGYFWCLPLKKKRGDHDIAGKGKSHPATGRIFLTFCNHTHWPPLPRRNPWYSFSGAESTPGHMVPWRGATGKIPSDTTDPGTVRLVAQCFNHYATPGPSFSRVVNEMWQNNLKLHQE